MAPFLDTEKKGSFGQSLRAHVKEHWRLRTNALSIDLALGGAIERLGDAIGLRLQENLRSRRRVDHELANSELIRRMGDKLVDKLLGPQLGNITEAAALYERLTQVSEALDAITDQDVEAMSAKEIVAAITAARREEPAPRTPVAPRSSPSSSGSSWGAKSSRSTNRWGSKFYHPGRPFTTKQWFSFLSRWTASIAFHGMNGSTLPELPEKPKFKPLSKLEQAFKKLDLK